MLRCLDMAELVEAASVALVNRQKHRGDTTPPGESRSRWFSPMKQPEMVGDWDRIRSAQPLRRVPETTPAFYIRLTERGRAEMARARRDVRDVLADNTEDHADAFQRQPVAKPLIGERSARRPVPKPEGWTRSELVAQAKDAAAGGFSASTFDSIRKAAGVNASERGGRGQQRRFSRSELTRLIAATEAGKFRNKATIAHSWSQLLGHLTEG